MKKKALERIGLCAVAAVGIAAGCVWRGGCAPVDAFITFPMKQIGGLLRWMSLSGSAGNAAAIALYAAIGLLPLIFLAFSVKKRGFVPEDALLLALCPFSFCTLYFMINPMLLSTWFGDMAQVLGSGQLLLCGCCWSIALGYAVLRFIREIKGGKADVEKCIRGLLYIICVIFALAAFCGCFGEYLGKIDRLNSAGNDLFAPQIMIDDAEISFSPELLPEKLFLTIKLLAEMLPYLLDIMVAMLAIRLIDALKNDRDGETPIAAADKLSKLSVKALVITTVAGIAVNVLQLLFAHRLSSLECSVVFPVFPLAFILAMLLTVGLLRERKSYRDDSESII